ncbi:N-6 DNA methylase [Streptacidiphilus sp. P02-A3a]|nr:N-6 DNA methylase [Streptacidiphilus sp. P02-A3a]
MTAGGIARLAGVGRAAVSNWRRRYQDFPRPVGGTDTSPAFDLDEVEQWLRSQGKLTLVPLRERIWQQVEQAPGGAGAALRLVGCALLLSRELPQVWLKLAAAADGELAAGLPGAFAEVLRARLGERHPVAFAKGIDELSASVGLLRGSVDLGRELGPRQAYEFLMGRHLDSGTRQYTVTPADPAELMAALAGPAAEVLDPACGSGGLLRAAAVGGSAVNGQEADPDLAALTALRLALHTEGPVRIQVADSLRADAFPSRTADAVLCHPPFNERNWGHGELAYDARWEYGFPPRTESELAWVQHALAHVRENGTVVLLMPPAAASRRSGRRIRADLLRRGALRAVIALPAGAAPPYGIPLHLWVLRRPAAGQPLPQHLLLVDAGGPASAGGEKLPWQTVRTAALDAWQAFDQQDTLPEQPGVSVTRPLVELLDDDVDLAPARHLPQPGVGGGANGLSDVRERFTDTLRRTAELAPVTVSRGAPANWPLTSVAELARAGALETYAGGTAPVASAPGAGPGHPGVGGAASGAGTAVLTEHDVATGGAPSGVLPEDLAEQPLLTRVGDVVVPLLGRGSVTRVVDAATAGAALGRNVQLLRPDPTALDSWFLAGFLRGTANNRQASSYTTTSTRLDVRRLQVPRMPPAEQRRYGAHFRALAAFEDTLRLAGQLGEQLVQGLCDGLTDGSVHPD